MRQKRPLILQVHLPISVLGILCYPSMLPQPLRKTKSVSPLSDIHSAKCSLATKSTAMMVETWFALPDVSLFNQYIALLLCTPLAARITRPMNDANVSYINEGDRFLL